LEKSLEGSGEITLRGQTGSKKEYDPPRESEIYITEREKGKKKGGGNLRQEEVGAMR